MSADNNTTATPIETSRKSWAEMLDDKAPKSPSYAPPAEEDRSQVDPNALRLAETFYDRYKRAIHALHHRLDLQKLYEDTFDSWIPADATKVDFSKVLFAMAREMKIVKVADHGRKLLWKGNMPQQRDDRRPRDDVRPREQRIEEYRPRHYDERPRPQKRFEDPTRRNYDERPRNTYDERPRNTYDNRRQPRSNSRPPMGNSESDVAEIKRNQDKMNELIRNQQKMIETLMSVSKVLNQ